MSLSGGSTLPDLNPTNKKKWLEKLREHELDPSSISVSDISKTSASKLTERAYLQIKVLRKNHSITQFSIRDYVSLSQLEFMNSASWQEHFAEHLEPYFDLFEQPVHHLRSMKKPGLFAAAKYFQSLVFTEINLGASPVLADETDGVAVNTRPTTRSQSRQRGRAETHEAHSSRDQLYGTPPRERSASTGSGRGPGPVTVPTTPIVPLTARIAHIYLGGGNGNEPSSSSAPLALPATPWSPATASQSAATGDEQIVNFALVLLLHATIVPIRQLRYVDWTPSRIALRLGSLPPPDDGGAVAGSERGRTSHALAARTDGLLRAQDGTQFPLAILECKAYVRSANQRAVEWQEGAQLACLVADCPQVPLANYRNHGLLTSPRGSNLKRRLLISQNRHEVWITIAQYDPVYESYVKEGRPPSPSPRNRVLFEDSPLARYAGRVPMTPGESSSRAAQDENVLSAAAARAAPEAVRGYEPGFLVLNTYGPWATGSESHMRELCQHITALSLQLAPLDDYFE